MAVLSLSPVTNDNDARSLHMVPSALPSLVCHFLAPAQELQPLWALAVTMLTSVLPVAQATVFVP